MKAAYWIAIAVGVVVVLALFVIGMQRRKNHKRRKHKAKDHRHHQAQQKKKAEDSVTRRVLVKRAIRLRAARIRDAPIFETADDFQTYVERNRRDLVLAAKRGGISAMQIGNNYLASPESRLSGCINDVDQMNEQLLRPCGVQSRVVLTERPGDIMPLKRNILSALSHWLSANAKRGAFLILHYSGHGSWSLTQRADSDNGMSECIVPIDYLSAGMIYDYELHDLLYRGLQGTGAFLFIVFDCCHSGSATNLPYAYIPSGSGSRRQLRKVRDDSAKQAPLQDAHILYLAGCFDEQTSADLSEGGRAFGALTDAVCTVMGGKREFTTLTAGELAWGIEQQFRSRDLEQRFQFSSTFPFNENGQDPIYPRELLLPAGRSKLPSSPTPPSSPPPPPPQKEDKKKKKKHHSRHSHSHHD